MQLHFPFVEFGLVRPLCGERRSKNAWTTSHRAVTCPRCLALLGEQEERPTVAPRAPLLSAAEPAGARTPRSHLG